MRIESESNENSAELKTLVVENVKLTRDLAHSIKKIKRYMFWLQVVSWFKFLILAVPLVLAAIYLPPLLSNLTRTYGELLGNKEGEVNLQELLKSPAVQELLKKK
ncbi:hypothetical protein HYT45_00645 [Candidatus Uhrbacteria bacterium]|nr:hypothetical protein [Candidatus Uhrbacteria bacterium]